MRNTDSTLLLEKQAYTKSTSTICHELRTNLENGLAGAEAEKRLAYFGLNVLPTRQGPSIFYLIFKQLKDFMILVLIAVAIVSFLVHDIKDAIVILAVVVINTILGFVQEYKAEKTIESLKVSASPKAKIMRDGKYKVIPTSQVVPGDILIIEEGDMIQADGRIFELVNLSTQESFLTGESLPASKSKELIDKKFLSIGDQKNIVFRGSVVATGHAKVIVTATGEDTELGKIAHLISEIKDKPTPLEIKLGILGKNLVMLTIILCLLVATIGILQGIPTLMMLKTAIVLGVACIPEGLVAVVTIALALGVQRMAKRKAIIRRLPAVEALGAVTTICSDKTGTLTEGTMMAQVIHHNDQDIKVTGHGFIPIGELLYNNQPLKEFSEELKLMMLISTLCNNSTLQKKGQSWEVFGDPTESALMVLAAKAGYFEEALSQEYQFIKEAQFDSKRKCMSKTYKTAQSTLLLCKGAPEKILAISSEEQIEGAAQPLHAEKIKDLHDKMEELASKGFRVLALGYRKLSQIQEQEDPALLEKNMIFLGFIAIADPIREEAKASIQICHEAGIRTMVITGDHQHTANYIGSELGIVSHDNQVMNCSELEELSPSDFDQALLKHHVLSRVSPHIKLKVVEGLKRQGQIVAMTGDGVNDAPAIKRANVGIAMGVTGTDVAKEAADIVLADDNFATIVSAVEEGRTIYGNILKFIRYLLSCNMGEIFIMLLATLFALPLPFIPIQILWLNLVTDTPPALALGLDPAPDDIMKRPARNPNEPILSNSMIIDVLFNGLVMALIVLSVFVFEIYYLDAPIEKARTMAFASLVFIQLLHAFNCQTQTMSIFSAGFFTNKYLIAAIIISILLLLMGMYVPLFQNIFELHILHTTEWVTVLVSSIVVILSAEIQKIFRRRSNLRLST